MRLDLSLIGYILALLLTGLIVGGLGRLALPGRDPMSIFQTILVGVAGSFAADANPPGSRQAVLQRTETALTAGAAAAAQGKPSDRLNGRALAQRWGSKLRLQPAGYLASAR